jgi:hypothetical protein
MYPYNNGQYGGFNASDEILAAIEEIAGDDILEEDSEAYRIWAEPTDEEIKKVEARAWELDKHDSATLHWGETTIRRPA